MPAERDGCARNNDGGADVAAHGVKRDTNLAWHQNPGNLVWRGRQ
jgi:hypothetical protein